MSRTGWDPTDPEFFFSPEPGKSQSFPDFAPGGGKPGPEGGVEREVAYPISVEGAGRGSLKRARLQRARQVAGVPQNPGSSQQREGKVRGALWRRGGTGEASVGHRLAGTEAGGRSARRTMSVAALAEAGGSALRHLAPQPMSEPGSWEDMGGIWG